MSTPASMPRRVCLFAMFHPRHRIRPHVLHYVAHLQACGYQTVVACSGDRLPPKEDRDALRDTGATMVFRPNHGLDFGAWQHLVREGCTDDADQVLLANDSVFGPFADLAPIMRRMEAKRLDVWGMIESRQHAWHLQSWFLHFTADAFRRPAVARVFAQDFGRMNKDEIIGSGELALGAALRAEGLRCGAVVDRRDAAWVARHYPMNPMHLDWRRNLLSGRLPFLKADLLRTNNMNIPWAWQWEAVLRDRLKVPTQPIHDYLHEYTGKAPDFPGQPYQVPLRTVPLGQLASYVLCSRDHRPALRGFVDALKSELFTGKS